MGLSLKNAQLATTGVGAVSVIMTAIVVRPSSHFLWDLGGRFIFFLCFKGDCNFESMQCSDAYVLR